MIITKYGKPQKAHGEFRFRCEKCGCEWAADRGDKGLNISPPCFEFFAYMKCPNCETEARDKDHPYTEEKPLIPKLHDWMLGGSRY